MSIYYFEDSSSKKYRWYLLLSFVHSSLRLSFWLHYDSELIYYYILGNMSQTHLQLNHKHSDGIIVLSLNSVLWLASSSRNLNYFPSFFFSVISQFSILIKNEYVENITWLTIWKQHKIFTIIMSNTSFSSWLQNCIYCVHYSSVKPDPIWHIWLFKILNQPAYLL